MQSFDIFMSTGVGYYVVEVTQWHFRRGFVNHQACDTIQLCLTKDQKYFVMKESLAKELGEKLESKHMMKSIENWLFLKKKLFQFHYMQGMTMNQYLNNFNKILVDLQNLDVSIEDEHKALLLLYSLLDTYDHLTTTLLYGKYEIKFDDVSNALWITRYERWINKFTMTNVSIDN